MKAILPSNLPFYSNIKHEPLCSFYLTEGSCFYEIRIICSHSNISSAFTFRLSVFPHTSQICIIFLAIFSPSNLKFQIVASSFLFTIPTIVHKLFKTILHLVINIKLYRILKLPIPLLHFLIKSIPVEICIIRNI